MTTIAILLDCAITQMTFSLSNVLQPTVGLLLAFCVAIASANPPAHPPEPPPILDARASYWVPSFEPVQGLGRDSEAKRATGSVYAHDPRIEAMMAAAARRNSNARAARMKNGAAAEQDFDLQHSAHHRPDKGERRGAAHFSDVASGPKDERVEIEIAITAADTGAALGEFWLWDDSNGEFVWVPVNGVLTRQADPAETLWLHVAPASPYVMERVGLELNPVQTRYDLELDRGEELRVALHATQTVTQGYYVYYTVDGATNFPRWVEQPAPGRTRRPLQPADVAGAGEDRGEGDPGDRGREGKGKVDHGIDEPSARKPIPNQHPGDDEAED